MSDTDRQFVRRRTLLISIALVAVLVAGVVLFFLFGSDVEPLLGADRIPTATHA